jgi:hypothetical protein
MGAILPQPGEKNNCPRAIGMARYSDGALTASLYGAILVRRQEWMD